MEIPVKARLPNTIERNRSTIFIYTSCLASHVTRKQAAD